MKSPFNWVGNKYKYMEIINTLVKNKKYNDVVDCFMGSGNILFNLECNANRFIGNDKVKLLPNIYDCIRIIDDFNINHIEIILNQWNRFSSKEDYYNFREYWNNKYKNNRFNDSFIYETALLLKMCSNSMVRFNSKGEFNQGFRGLGKKTEFFTDTMKKIIVDGLNDLNVELNKNNYEFTTEDVLNILPDENDLLILDPPYILRDDMYSMDFSKKHNEYLINLLNENRCDFIYFNYLERDGAIYNELNDMINKNNYYVIELSNKTGSGQNRKGTKDIKEVLVTNIGGVK